MRRPGIEPGSPPWEGRIIPIDHQRLALKKSIYVNINITIIVLSIIKQVEQIFFRMKICMYSKYEARDAPSNVANRYNL